MKQESLRRTPMNFAEEPMTYLSDLVAHVLCIEREQACQWNSQQKIVTQNNLPPRQREAVEREPGNDMVTQKRNVILSQYLEKSSVCNNVYTVTRLPALYWFRLPYIQKEKKDPSKLPHPTPPHSKKGPFKRSIKIPKLLAISKFRDSPKVTITWFLRIKKK